MSQSQLLKNKKFAPFFATQFFGAFNDNIFKNCLMLIVAYHAVDKIAVDTNLLLNLAAGLFILPFFLFSAIAGQITDKYDKAMLMRRIKLAEIVLMSFAALAFIFELYYVLLALLFLMGSQSTFFGPAKYAILPQHLKPEELVGGNALVEMGTFVAILLGTIGAGFIVQQPQYLWWSAVLIVVFAVIGYVFSRSIPSAPSSQPDLQISWNPLTNTYQMVKLIKADKPSYLAILAISWFWFLGAAYLTQFPNYSKVTLQGDESVVTLLLAIFTLGIGVGSMLCEKLSSSRVELGIVPFGAIGLSVFGVDLYFASQVNLDHSITWLMYFTGEQSSRVLIDLLGIGIFGGLFIVPLYAYVQKRAAEEVRARTIAVINIINALFMVASAITAMILLGMLNLTIPEFFLALSIMNVIVCVYIFVRVKDFFIRFVVWCVSHTMYRVKHVNLSSIPETGAGVIVCNHVSYMDALLIAGASPRPIRFVMDYKIFKTPVLSWFFKLVNAIPIAPKHKDEETYHNAFDEISKALNNDELVCIFPEGKLTDDGEIKPFKAGIEQIIERDPVPVIPLALVGLWGSFFSHKDRPALQKAPKRFWSKVKILASAPVMPEQISSKALEDIVLTLKNS
ncbi:MAG: MFS transporter [Oleiphilaceae bacterium]|nr:MFS transporter [Oleiphilaceae bacterium]